MINPINPLAVVLERVGCADPVKGAFFFWDEVNAWPTGSLGVLVASGLLKPAQPMATIECDGCEENCMMPVEVYPTQEDRQGRAFITCDKRDDMGRIKVSFDRMRQWQSTGEFIAAALTRLLGLSQLSKQRSGGRQWPVGTIKGKKYSSPVMLLADDGLGLSLAGHTAQLMDVLVIEKSAITLNKDALNRLVDNPSGDGETREARKTRLISRVGEEKAKGTKAFLRVVADEEGISTSRLKQLVKDDAPVKEDEPNNSPWAGLSVNRKQTSSKKTKPKY